MFKCKVKTKVIQMRRENVESFWQYLRALFEGHFCSEEERERCLHTSRSCLHVTLNLKETQSADLCSTELVEIF